METFQRFVAILVDEFARKTGFDADRLKMWLGDPKRRRLTYAGAMFALSLFILLVYACSQQPDV